MPYFFLVRNFLLVLVIHLLLLMPSFFSPLYVLCRVTTSDASHSLCGHIKIDFAIITPVIIHNKHTIAKRPI